MQEWFTQEIARWQGFNWWIVLLPILIVFSTRLGRIFRNTAFYQAHEKEVVISQFMILLMFSGVLLFLMPLGSLAFPIILLILVFSFYEIVKVYRKHS